MVREFTDLMTILPYNCSPTQGHSFVGWEKEDGTILSVSPEFSINIDGNINLLAKFSRNQYAVAGGSSLGGGFKIYDANGSEASTFFHGPTYNISANPDPLYDFYWLGRKSIYDW